MEMTELEKIAKQKKELNSTIEENQIDFGKLTGNTDEIEEAFEDDVETEEMEDNDIDEDSPVIAGLGSFEHEEPDVENEESEEEEDDFEDDEDEMELFSKDNIMNASNFGMDGNEDLRSLAPELSDEEYMEVLSKSREQTAVYRKSLLINEGLSKEEADEAAENHLKKLIAGENTAKLEKNPKVGVIEINKKDADNLELTEEEHEKLSRVKSIKLVMVEEEELKSIKIKKFDKKHKGNYVKNLDGNLARYSVPLPSTGDYATFKGTQLVQILSTVKYEDDSLDEVISKKAGLLYDRLCDATILNKYDEKGKVKLTFTDFINKYKYHDLDMGLYAIVIASSVEDIETHLTCPSCHNSFDYKYNLKTLLDLSDMSENYKEITDNILANKSNKEKLIEINSENSMSQRFKSTITNNIYDIGLPSIGRAINLMKTIDQTDEVMVYLSAPALFIDNALIYDEECDDYYPIEETEYRELMEFMQTIPDNELQLINKVASEKIYVPKFVLKSKCPHCGLDLENKFSIDEMVFLKAQGTQTEIQ